MNSLSFSLPHTGLGAGSRVLFVRTILKSWRFPFLVKEEAGSIFAHTRYPRAKGPWDNIIINFIICQAQRRRRKQRGKRTLAHFPVFCKKPEFPPESKLTTDEGEGWAQPPSPITHQGGTWIGHLFPRDRPHKNHLSWPAMVLSFKYRQGQFGPWSHCTEVIGWASLIGTK